jgi:single-stranded DNA-binding protein
MSEPLEHFYLNTTTIAGTVGQYRIKVQEQENGSPRASFAVAVQEEGYDERLRTVYLDVVAWGKVAEGARTLRADQPVLIEGKLVRTLRQQKGKGDQWYTTVQARKIVSLADQSDERQASLPLGWSHNTPA